MRLRSGGDRCTGIRGRRHRLVRAVRPAPRDALGDDAVGDPRGRGDVAADTDRSRRAVLAAVPRTLADAGRLRGGTDARHPRSLGRPRLQPPAARPSRRSSPHRRRTWRRGAFRCRRPRGAAGDRPLHGEGGRGQRLRVAGRAGRRQRAAGGLAGIGSRWSGRSGRGRPTDRRRRPGTLGPRTMDLAATICTRRRPRCDACPLAELCLSRGTTGEATPARDASPAPFESTSRWLRGRVLARLREARANGWVVFDAPIGTHDLAAVRAALADLEAEGFIDLESAAAGGADRARLRP